MSAKPELILASGSPRRQAMLSDMGVPFSVQISGVDEARRDNEQPEDYVTRLARDKAIAAHAKAPKHAVVLAADTIVIQGERVFGKPRDFDHAKQIWQALSNAKHQVLTAVCLKVADRQNVKVAITDVEFGAISESQMHAYWASNEPQDKAGAYAIQGLASAWVKNISGSYSNVVGLPLREVNQLLTTIDLNWL